MNIQEFLVSLNPGLKEQLKEVTSRVRLPMPHPGKYKVRISELVLAQGARLNGLIPTRTLIKANLEVLYSESIQVEAPLVEALSKVKAEYRVAATAIPIGGAFTIIATKDDVSKQDRESIDIAKQKDILTGMLGLPEVATTPNEFSSTEILQMLYCLNPGEREVKVLRKNSMTSTYPDAQRQQFDAQAQEYESKLESVRETLRNFAAQAKGLEGDLLAVPFFAKSGNVIVGLSYPHAFAHKPRELV